MQQSRPSSRARKFISASEGERFAVFDLTGKQRRTERLRVELDQQQKLLTTSLSREFGRLLNQSNLQIQIEPWQAGKPPEAVPHWLAAFDAATPQQLVGLGFDSKSLFSASELFFGGNPAKLSEQELATRSPSETEQRLALRLFNSLLGILCPALDLSLADWQSRWQTTQPETDGLWTELRITSHDWSLRLYCCWPLELQNEPLPEPSPVTGMTDELSASLSSVKIKLKVELAQLALTLADLLQLKAGDILRMDLHEISPAAAGKNVCLTGQVCEQGDQLALKVVKGVGER